MANKGIKGITIEIGGDTTGLTDALKDVNSASKKTQDELKEVERALKFDPGNADLIRQRQDLLTQSIQQTSDKLQTLRTAQQQVQEQFDRGDINAEQYRAFQRELAQTESALRNYEGRLNSMDSEQERFNDAQQRLQTYIQATGQSADDLASTLGSRLANAIRDGSASTDQMEMALRRIGQAAGHSGEDLQEFQRVLREAAGNNNLDEVRRDLDQIGDAAEEAEKDISGLGATIGGLAAGGGIAGAVAAAMSDADVKAIIDVTFDVPEESKDSVLEAIRNVQTYGVDAEQALEGVRRQWALNADATDESNQRVTQSAAAISKAYADIDFWELIQEANEIGGVLEITTQEAIDMTNALLKAGFDPNQLDIISEYGNQLKMAGFNAQEIQAIMASGVDTKTWNIDNLLDGIKEGRIVGAEFGATIDDATKGIIESAGLSATKFQELGKAIASGGEEGGAAMQEMAKMLASVEDDTVRNQLGVKMYGTLWEEQGTKIVDTLMNMDNHMTTASENTQLMNDTVSGLDASPMVRMQQAAQDILTALSPVFDVIAAIVVKIAEWASENPTLIAAIVAISTVLGILIGAFAALMPAIGGVVTAWPAIVAGFGAISAPVALAVAALVGLGVAFIALWKNSESFRDNLKNVFDAIKDIAVQVFENVASFIGDKISQIKGFWDKEGAQILAAAENIFNGIMAVVKFVMPAVQLVINTVWGAIKNIINGALDVIMGAVKVFSGLFTGDFSKMWEGVKSIFKGAVDLVLGIMTLSFVGGIRTLITNLVKTVVTAIKGKWTSIVELFKSGGTGAVNSVKTMATNVVNYVKNLATNFVNSISTMKTNVVSKMSEIKDDIINKVKEINLVQVGKDIISGLIKGITSMTSAAIESMSGVVDGVINKAKNMLGIKSPSRVFMAIGKDTNEGFVKGMASNQQRLQDAVQSAYSSLGASAQKATQMNVTNNAIHNQAAQPTIDLNGLVAAITQLANQPIVVQSVLEGRVISESVSRNQQQAYNIAAIAKGVSAT